MWSNEFYIVTRDKRAYFGSYSYQLNKVKNENTWFFHYAIFPRHTGTGADKQKEPTLDLSIIKLLNYSHANTSMELIYVSSKNIA